MSKRSRLFALAPALLFAGGSLSALPVVSSPRSGERTPVGTVREDYSDSGNAWDYFSHDQARSRAYRWGEDGLAGISDERSCCELNDLLTPS